MKLNDNKPLELVLQERREKQNQIVDGIKIPKLYPTLKLKTPSGDKTDCLITCGSYEYIMQK